MFSGIVEEYGVVKSIEREKENYHFTLSCSFVDELKVDQSVAHNGVCLTVVKIDSNAKTYVVTAIKETILKTNLGTWEVGSKVNLERSMMMNGRLDGHIVQGHVDQVATCVKKDEADGSFYFTFEYAFNQSMAKQGYMTVEKGSVTVNGVSLTVVNSQANSFQVAIIPYTYNETNFHTFEVGSVVNLEFDIIGKYLAKLSTFN
ncbi:MAG: riboflavin synthase [Mangrovibacterium sp.]